MTPRDCVVVFRMPEPMHGVQIVVVKNQAAHNVQAGYYYRTSALSFPEASKRAAHYAVASEDVRVEVATRAVLDRFIEVPLTEEMTAHLYSQPTPRGFAVRDIRRRESTN